MAQGRRKASKLSRSSPLAPPVDNQMDNGSNEAPEEAVTPQGAAMTPEAPAAPKKASQAAPKASKKKKVSFYLVPEEEKRAKAAWQFTMGHTEHLTWTSFFEEAVRRYTRELEAKHNDSRPFIKSDE